MGLHQCVPYQITSTVFEILSQRPNTPFRFQLPQNPQPSAPSLSTSSNFVPFLCCWRCATACVFTWVLPLTVCLMKRIGFFLSFLFLFFPLPMLLPARCDVPAAVSALDTELPWSTVQAVLKAVADQGNYAYPQLVSWYDSGLLTVEQSGSSYVVRIYDADGALDVILIDIH